MSIHADTLRAVFDRLVAAGLRPPVDLADRQAVATLADLWAEQWRHRSDADLVDACRAFLAQPQRWWPSPGHLLALAPAQPVRQLGAQTPLERAEQLMGRVSSAAYEADPSGTLSLQLLDQVLDAEGDPACGAARCIGAECVPCTERRTTALEQAWDAWRTEQRRAS